MKRKHTFTVVIERDEDGGYVASVVELPGCHTQGDSLNELRANVREAIGLYLEDEKAPARAPEFVAVERIEVSA